MFLYIVGLVALFLIYRWLKELKRVPNKGDRFVYITGCDSGFGNLLARHLDTLGYRVIAGCYTEKGEDELRKITSDRMTTLQLDVTDAASVAKAADNIKSLVGNKGLWAVVNNAGVTHPSAPTDWLTIEDYRGMLAVNLDGVISVTLSILPLIKKAKGRVVNVSSVFGRISPFGGPYSISKYGVEAFTDSLRVNMSPFGVTVCCLEPGFFRTNAANEDLMEASLTKLWNKLPQDVKDDYGHDFKDKALALMNKRLAQILDPDLMKVVSCMEHAISAVHPRKRYSPGYDTKMLWLPLSYMPSCLTDWWFSRNRIKLKISSVQ
ncbi:retinol dehydrogenase 7-like [Boleophthalmus pectinirostris]|uniref:retinol dehydrogenase 7-like n=1 Tax=Boleophthalmus pectinirostris TaxID=150288 RepID=UPI0024308BD6|nr:retinol dehydrogenase 7-like [Boleophthalmus pectinirostris]XP_055009474.1 retinol dehydrogenase 7-like [Boleophthalmus pectinirostris]